MVRQNQVRAPAHGEVLADGDAFGLELIHFFDQCSWIHHNTVTDHAGGPSVQNTGWDEMENVGPPFIDDRVPGIGPALIADDDVGIFGQDIDNLAFAFITPLDANDDEITHLRPLRFTPTRKKGSDPTGRSEPRESW